MTQKNPTPDRPPVGQMLELEPGLRRIIAPNPSPMTYWGTNTFILGEGDVAVVDPGPAIRSHLDAILAGLHKGERVKHILVTHAHLDHSELAPALAEATGAPIIAFGDATAGRSDIMQDLVARGLTSGGEGVDAGFAPDICVADGETFDAGGLPVETIWTPGHFANHVSFASQGFVLTGDHVMGWASSLVSPPDGDLTAFMASCVKLADRTDRIYYPAHGAAISDPAPRINWLISRRKSREAEILGTLSNDRPTTVLALTRTIYKDTPPALIPAAERNVFAHLIDLSSRKIVTASPELRADAVFHRIG
ncbi:MBL fold metallo-hydrolase [Aliiroseovarius sp. 2305UL8-7]|uniref:MBL fold metallo-hydrolase n=1 Tax=Aliiroseovarius conchicola TaxID=3121637 RepID=UPI0035293A5C